MLHYEIGRPQQIYIQSRETQLTILQDLEEYHKLWMDTKMPKIF
jgi:hypothetical protein